MTTSASIELLRKGRAYRLFIAEYGERISFAEQVLDSGIDAESQRDLKARFHMLKGSAGFFGFDHIRAIAAELEDLFSKPHSLDAGEVDSAQQRITALREFQAQMPPPQGGE